MWRLSFRPELEDDIAQAVDWYNDKRSGLGDEFLTEFQAAIGRIYDNPLLFAIAENGLRPCRLRRFSYIIHIDVSGNDVLIVAVMGGGRDDTVFAYRYG